MNRKIITVCAGICSLGIAVFALAAPGPHRTALPKGELFRLWTPQVVANTQMIYGDTVRVTVRNFNLPENHPFFEPGMREIVGSVVLTLNGTEYDAEPIGSTFVIDTPLEPWLHDFDSQLTVLGVNGDLITDHSLGWVYH